jgi:adiponectin receptor
MFTESTKAHESSTLRRPTSKSLRKSLSSIFAIHNETVNINSHLVGSALFYVLPFAFGRTAYVRAAKALPQDYVVFTIYLVNIANPGPSVMERPA